MPQRRPCAGSCGRLLSYNPFRGSLEQPTCRECRRKARLRICEKCLVQFDPGGKPRARAPRRFCSAACRVRARQLYEHPRAASKASTRARKARRRLTWDGVTDQQIFERDGWRCLIPGCGRPIQHDLRHPDPISASIDHIVPLSRGGDDTEANKRAAHLVCNTRRGARDIVLVPVVRARRSKQGVRDIVPVPVLVITPEPVLAVDDGRCLICGYLRSATGHLMECNI